MKLFKPILIMQLLHLGAGGTASRNGGTPVSLVPLVAGQSIIMNPIASGFAEKPKATVDLPDYGVTGDGRTNDTMAVSALLKTIGSSTIRLIFPSGSPTLLNAISFPANVTLDFSAGGALKPATGQTITIHGGIIGNTQQIFYNALPGQGTIDFTGGTAYGPFTPNGGEPRREGLPQPILPPFRQPNTQRLESTAPMAAASLSTTANCNFVECTTLMTSCISTT